LLVQDLDTRLPDFGEWQCAGALAIGVSQPRILPTGLGIDIGVEALRGAVDAVQIQQEDIDGDGRRAALVGHRAPGIGSACD
jgi:hypothetical protein